MSVLLGRRDENQNGNRGNRDSELESGGEKKGEKNPHPFRRGPERMGHAAGSQLQGGSIRLICFRFFRNPFASLA